MNRPIYITAACQISPQQPLSEQWMQQPIAIEGGIGKALLPDFKQWLNPMKSRRWDALLKRALTTSLEALRISATSRPDAIITGTGMGCLGSTSAFLSALTSEGETVSQPTHFMQSTHNTIGSLIAMQTGCHGYNTTHSQGAMSADVALLDAFTLIEAGMAQHVLVGAHDQLLDEWVAMLRKAGNQHTLGEVSVALMLTTQPAVTPLCTMTGISVASNDVVPDAVQLCGDTLPDVVICGEDTPDSLLPHVPRVRYHHLCGESPSASAFGVYMTAQCLQRGEFPSHTRCDGHDSPLRAGSALVVNHEGQQHSLIMLTTP